jgi:hypothetical protein
VAAGLIVRAAAGLGVRVAAGPVAEAVQASARTGA